MHVNTQHLLATEVFRFIARVHFGHALWTVAQHVGFCQRHVRVGMGRNPRFPSGGAGERQVG